MATPIITLEISEDEKSGRWIFPDGTTSEWWDSKQALYFAFKEGLQSRGIQIDQSLADSGNSQLGVSKIQYCGIMTLTIDREKGKTSLTFENTAKTN